MNDGNGLDQQVATLREVTRNQASTAAALHATAVEIRPYAVTMRWTPMLLALIVLCELFQAYQQHEILTALLRG